MIRVGHVARMGEPGNAYKILVGKPVGKRPLERARCRWEGNIKMVVTEMGWDRCMWLRIGAIGGILWTR